MDFSHGVSKVGPLKVWENKIVKKVQICVKCSVRARSYDTGTDLYSQNTLSPEQILHEIWLQSSKTHPHKGALMFESGQQHTLLHIRCGSDILLSLICTLARLCDSYSIHHSTIRLTFIMLYITLILELKLNFLCLGPNITLLMLY